MCLLSPECTPASFGLVFSLDSGGQSRVSYNASLSCPLNIPRCGARLVPKIAGGVRASRFAEEVLVPGWSVPSRVGGALVLVALACSWVAWGVSHPHRGHATAGTSYASRLAPLRGETLPAVRQGQARRVGRAPAARWMSLNLGLPLRHRSRLYRFLFEQALHGHYLTQSQFDSRFGASPERVRRVERWANRHGLRITYVSRDGLAITVQGSVSRVQFALRVKVGTFRGGDRLYYANNADPIVPSSLGLASITGLNDRFRAGPTDLHRLAVPFGGYGPAQFRTAYDVDGHGVDGTGQTLGITGFGPPVSNQDLAAFAQQTGDPAVTSCSSTATCSQPDTIRWVQIGKQSNDSLAEQALDVEYMHGMAVHSRLKYFLGGDGSETPMEDAISMAANDSSIHVVSNSWSQPGVRSASDPFVKQTTNSFVHAVAVGTTFYFSTGDNAAFSGCVDPSTHCRLASYPAASPYVVAVGGTNLQMTPTFNAYSGETTWSLSLRSVSGSGGGCAAFLRRPMWQRGVSTASCKGRAVPDVSADADPNSGGQVYFDGGTSEYGGTSLSAPLFAGMMAVTNRYLRLNGLPPTGFAAPLIYKVARSGLYNAAFHDVLCGSNTYPAGLGWDEATGWGSIDWYAFSRLAAGQSVDPLPSATSWSCRTPSGTASDLRAIACTSRTQCHVVGGAGTIRNTDDAWNWSRPRHATASATLVGVSCPSSTACSGLVDTGRLQHTTDAGQTWRPLNLHLSRATGLSCPSVSVCYIIGGKTIVKASNAKSYVRQKNPSTAALVAISCPAATHCFAIQADGLVLRTTNGKTWRRAGGTRTTPGTISALSCPTVSRCYAVGGARTPNAQGGSALIYSTSNAKTWMAPVVGAGGPLSAVSCSGSTTCDAVGPRGDILRTTGGVAWAPALSYPIHRTFEGIACPPGPDCYAVAKKGVIVQIGTAPGH